MDFFNLATAVSFTLLIFATIASVIGVVFWILAIAEGFKFQESVDDLDREIRKHNREESVRAINEINKDWQKINADFNKQFKQDD